MKLKIITLILFSFFLMIGCNWNDKEIEKKAEQLESSVKVTLKQKNGVYKLFVDSKPFYIKGAGLEFGDIASVSKHKGNSIRTWRTNNGRKTGKEVLDEAHKNGLKVTMGIEVARERHGFDYNDSNAVKEQLERIKQEVLELKDHPALLIWGIGNELNLHYENPKVWDAVNDISKMIHSVDPNHLTTTSLAGISQREINFIKERCPDLDLLSFQMYCSLPQLPKLVKEYGWEGAYIVTEWGATGHWEVPKTSWNAPIEDNSTIKAENYLKRYKSSMEVDTSKCIGSYVFLWGQKQERTPTWYGIFLEDGKETESVDVMHYIWNDETWPENRTPQVKSFELNGKTAYDNVRIKKNSSYDAKVDIHDFENDEVMYNWEILPESTDLKDGGDYEERPKNVHFESINKQNGLLTFKMTKPGNFRLFVYVYDRHGHAATANIPFQVY